VSSADGLHKPINTFKWLNHELNTCIRKFRIHGGARLLGGKPDMRRWKETCPAFALIKLTFQRHNEKESESGADWSGDELPKRSAEALGWA
jgi:hypothetical protein